MRSVPGRLAQQSSSVVFWLWIQIHCCTSKTQYLVIEIKNYAALSVSQRRLLPAVKWSPPDLSGIAWIVAVPHVTILDVLLQRLIASMDASNVTVLVFPTWSNVPPLIGDYSFNGGIFQLPV